MLLDPALRKEWLNFAKARSISSILVAPHATNVPLIGGGWGGARKAAFSEFLTQAAAQGLAVQLAASSSTMEGDVEFIRNCSAASH